MFILSCGLSSLQTPDVAQESDHGDSGSRAAIVAPLDGRRGSGGGDSSRSDQSEGEQPSVLRRVGVSMSNYDSMATRLKTASRSDFSSLWTSGCKSKPKETLAPSTADREEIAIPDLHIGQYQQFCLPQTWSSVFSSPGDFTVRVESAFERNGEIVFRIAVICCSIRAVKDGTAVVTTEATKRKSYIKFVERTERELIKFSETMALKYLGHRLTDKLPRLVMSVLSSTQTQLNAHADAITSYLSYVLSITEIGYNRLYLLTEAVAKNLVVREFFDLSLGFGDPAMISTSSCDARLEHRTTEDRLRLPSAWLSAIDAPHSRSFSLPRRDESPRYDLILQASPCRCSDSGYEFKALGLRSPSLCASNPHNTSGKCIRFVKPSRWNQDKSIEGAFTVEIVGVTVCEGRAKYTICVLSHVRGSLELTTVDRRFSEFDSLVNRVESKLRALSVRNHFPTKTLFRYLSVGYLERRAAHLQRFLEKLLQMRFLGVLDQEISMVAEPNIRKFLSLPSVQWSVTPWQVGRSPRALQRMHTARQGESPVRRTDSSPAYTSSPSSIVSVSSAAYETDDPSTPRYYNLGRRRSGSF